MGFLEPSSIRFFILSIFNESNLDRLSEIIKLMYKSENIFINEAPVTASLVNCK